MEDNQTVSFGPMFHVHTNLAEAIQTNRPTFCCFTFRGYNHVKWMDNLLEDLPKHLSTKQNKTKQKTKTKQNNKQTNTNNTAKHIS